MTRRERIRKTLQGERTDRPPMSFWRHFYDREDSAADLAEAMLEFQRKYDWDFMKVNPRASYHVEDWGVKIEYSGSADQGPRVVDWPIKRPTDWRKIEPLPVDRRRSGPSCRHGEPSESEDRPCRRTQFSHLSRRESRAKNRRKQHRRNRRLAVQSAQLLLRAAESGPRESDGFTRIVGQPDG